MNQRILLLCSVVLCSVVKLNEAGWERSCTSDDYVNRRGGGRCGRRLLQYVSSICTRGLILKRGGASEYNSQPSLTPKQPSAIFLNQDKAGSFLHSIAKKKDASNNHGIVCECCLNPCSQRELMEYCIPEKRKRRSTSATKQQKRSQESSNEYVNMDSIYAMFNDPTIDDRDMSLAELEQQPFIQLMNKQKYLNLQREKSLNTEINESDSIEQAEQEEQEAWRYDQLKAYLKENLLDFLAEGGTPSQITTEPTDSHKVANNELHRLWEMFHETNP